MNGGEQRRPAVASRVAWCLSIVLAAGCARQPPTPQNLVLISLDTLRRDHLSTYGYERLTSPTLDRLAAESIVFDDAFTHATNTAASHLTLFTGALADRHHVWTNGMPFDGSLPTLASTLAAAGFRTAGFASGLTMQGAANLGVGFAFYDDDFSGPRRDGAETVERATAWLRASAPAQPYFLFVHLFDVHGPYRPHSRPGQRFQSAEPGPTLAPIPHYQEQRLADGRLATERNFYVDRYDDAVRYEDGLVGRLLAAVDLASTLVVILADHGESLDERPWKLDHGGTVYDEELRVPLLVRVPGWTPRRVTGMVGLADVLPTVLELLAQPAPRNADLDGRSLVPALRTRRRPSRREVIAYAQVHPERFGNRAAELDSERAILGLRSDRFKLVILPGKAADVAELYDLLADPAEQQDVASRHPALRERMRRRLLSRIDPRRRAAPTAADRDLEEKLRALGYVAD